MIAFFPSEIVYEIFRHLPFASICKATRVSKSWRRYIVSSPSFYQELDFTIDRRSTITDQTVRTYLSRGKSCVKSLVCRCTPKLSETTLRSLRSIFGIRLQRIEITSNVNITDISIIPFIRAIGGHLKEIDFSGTGISKDGVKRILNTCSKLEILKLLSCPSVTSNSFEFNEGAFAQCNANELREIYFDLPIIPRLIELFPRLSTLHLQSSILFATTQSIANLTTFSNLKSVHLSCLIYEDLPIEDAFLKLSESCPPLREFTLQNCSQLTDNCIQRLVMSCNLEVLNLYGCNLLTDTIMNDIGFNCKELKILRIGKSPGITDAGISSLFKSRDSSKGSNSKLEIIDLKQNSNITDDSLKAIADNCDKIKEINFSWCRNITGMGIEYLVQKCKNSLRKLFLNECSSISLDAVVYARDALGIYGGIVEYKFRS